MRRHRISIPLILAIFLLLHAVFALELWLDLRHSARAAGIAAGPIEIFRALDGSAVMARMAGTTISRAYNVLVSMVLTSIALAIPITANMYTPKLIEIFIKDKVNIAVLAFFVLSSAQAIWSTQATWDRGPLETAGGVYPRVSLWLAFESITLGWAILIPYFYYVFRFLSPTNIIARVSELVTEEFDAIPREGGDIEEAQRELEQRILNLGNVILRAVDRADRDVTLDAIRALKRVMVDYETRKDRLPPAWFDVAADLFVGLSHEAIELIRKERIWVEQKCLHQLALAYNASLVKMPDAVSAISDVTRELVLNAESQHDPGTLELGVRYFNTFLREAVKKKDVHAIFDIFYQYKELARDLFGTHAGTALAIGRHIKYYADFARMNGLAFIYELACYEIASMLEWAWDRKVPARRELFDILLSFDAIPGSVRLARAKTIAGAMFRERGAEEEERLLAEHLAGLPKGLLEQALRDLLSTTNPIFWEVTDRQTNIDYIPEPRRTHAAAFVAGVLARPPADAPAPAALGARG
jgi:hypothetical protein